jgi:WD40 repeat protein
MALVTTDEDRGNSRDVYLPDGKRSMAHHSYLSPDGKWVLVVEMDSQTEILPCRIVPFQGGGDLKVVGPPGAECHAGAWSSDGKWIYLTAKTDDFHLWRQRFPDGEPEQITFGPTSQDGIAMAPDGKSLVTSVGSLDQTVWMHDKSGDHQVSSEGNTSNPEFSSDGHKLYFLMASGKAHDEGLWVKDLESGKVEEVLTHYALQNSRETFPRGTTPCRETEKKLHLPQMTRPAVQTCGLRPQAIARRRCTSPQRLKRTPLFSFPAATWSSEPLKAAPAFSTA